MVAVQPHTGNAIAEKFAVTRQSISLHIHLLIDCGLLTVIRDGRERFCQARLEQLGEVFDWVEQYRQHYERKLDNLEIYLKKIQKKKDGKIKK
jgi:hypothetical protein